MESPQYTRAKYLVQPGDTMQGIALRHHLKVGSFTSRVSCSAVERLRLAHSCHPNAPCSLLQLNELKRMNRLTSSGGSLFTGQVLCSHKLAIAHSSQYRLPVSALSRVANCPRCAGARSSWSWRWTTRAGPSLRPPPQASKTGSRRRRAAVAARSSSPPANFRLPWRTSRCRRHRCRRRRYRRQRQRPSQSHPWRRRPCAPHSPQGRGARGLRSRPRSFPTGSGGRRGPTA